MGPRLFKKTVSHHPFKSVALFLVFFLLPLDQPQRKEEECDLGEHEVSQVCWAMIPAVSWVEGVATTSWIYLDLVYPVGQPSQKDLLAQTVS